MTTSVGKKIHRSVIMVITALCLCGFTVTDGCKGPTPPVITAQLGQENQKLQDELKRQIDEQNKQITGLKDKDQKRIDQLDQIAGSSYGISIGTQHITEDKDQKGKDIVNAENGLIKEVAGEPSAKRKAESDARTISILQNDLVKQKELYGNAQLEIDNGKKAIADKDKEISARDQTIKDRDQKIVDQEVAAKAERVENAKAMTKTVNDYEQRIKDINDAAAKKERALWINVLRFGGFGVILAGVAALALSQGRALAQGLILIGSGAAIIGIGVAINVVISQVWFPIVAVIVGLTTLLGFGWFIGHLYQTHQLASKSAALLNDIETEAHTLTEAGSEEGKKLMAKIQPHIDYRLGKLKGALNSIAVKTGLDEKKNP